MAPEFFFKLLVRIVHNVLYEVTLMPYCSDLLFFQKLQKCNFFDLSLMSLIFTLTAIC